ncbi:MAG TPA: hypothetical protein VF681_00045 [Abditibacteriaceae bacterium]
MKTRNINIANFFALSGLISLTGFSQAKTAVVTPQPSSPSKATPSLQQMALQAFGNGDTQAATQYAFQMLKENTNRKAWYYGNTIHGANQILGLAALRERRTADARRYLIAAGKTPGSPQLDSFGPPMALAQALLEKGEKDTVIQYLDLVSKFWASSSPQQLKRIEKRKPGFAKVVVRMDKEKQQKINSWKTQIRAGKKPKLNDSGSIF